MESCLDALRDICARRDLDGLILLLRRVLPDYTPSADVLRRVIEPLPDSSAIQ
jgi:hypothetical protein